MNIQKPDAVELKPCPFCGGKVEISYCDEGCCGAKPRTILCINRGCGLDDFGVSADTDAEAIAQWNTRDTADRDKYRDACERLIGHYDGDVFNCRCQYGDAHLGEVCRFDIYKGEDARDCARQVMAEIEGGA